MQCVLGGRAAQLFAFPLDVPALCNEVQSQNLSPDGATPRQTAANEPSAPT